MASKRPVIDIDTNLSASQYTEFYQAARSAFEVARHKENDVPQMWLDLGGSVLRLSFAGTAMVPNIAPALMHLRIPSQSRADLDIAVWDSTSTGVSMTPPPWSAEDYLARGEIRNHSGKGGIDLAYHVGSGVLSMLEGETSSAMLWTQDASRCPYWEQAAPLRTILHWWCSRKNQQLVHGAAVGTACGAILLTGKGGSGKSTTALGALLAGMDYLGDDYVLCDLAACQPRVHSVFNTAKLDRDTFRYLPALRDKVKNPDRLNDEKAVVYTHDHFPEQISRTRELQAIVIPRVCDIAASRMVPLRPALAFLALSPTTVFQLPGAREDSLAFLKQLVEKLPCYQLELGRDPVQTAQLIQHFIESPA